MKVEPKRSFQDSIHLLSKKVEEEALGYHDQMIRICILLKEEGVSPQDCADLMFKASESVARRRVRAGEIENVVRWVFQNSDSSAGVKSKKVNRLKRNQDTIDAWSAKGSIKSLMAKSDSIPTDSSKILKLLYADQDLLHLSPDIFHDNIMECREWINSDLAKMQYLCPCKFKGKEKGRLAENVAERSFIVFETDERPNDWDGQAGLIERLAQELPLRMVLWSGNKSLHAWFDSYGANKDRIEQFHKMVVTLGGDRAVLRAAQMVRFPLGRNSKTGKKQEVVYFRNG
jgi:hypothetical protein